jgi:hypothetical protein
MKFVIDRSKWLRGEGTGDSFLLRPSDGKMCCVGQMCKQLGVSDDILRSRKSVGHLLNSMRKLTSAIVHLKLVIPELHGLLNIFVKVIPINGDDGEVVQEEFLQTAYVINDARSLAGVDGEDLAQAREARLTEIFNEAGHELEFVDSVSV